MTAQSGNSPGASDVEASKRAAAVPRNTEAGWGSEPEQAGAGSPSNREDRQTGWLDKPVMSERRKFGVKVQSRLIEGGLARAAHGPKRGSLFPTSAG